MKKSLVGTLVLLVLVALAIVVVSAEEPETTLVISGARGELELELNVEPVTTTLEYYLDSPELLMTEVEWHTTMSGTFTTTVATRDWSAFKVADLAYEVISQTPFWVDAPDDQTGWAIRGVFTPTLTVTDENGRSPVLTAWGIWGDEDLIYWELGEEDLYSGDHWVEIEPNTYQMAIVDVGGWESMKIATWPATAVDIQSVYWKDDGDGWVVRAKMPVTIRVYVPLVWH